MLSATAVRFARPVEKKEGSATAGGKEGKQRDIIGSLPISTVRVCVVSSREVGGEEEQEKGEDGVLPLETGLKS